MNTCVKCRTLRTSVTCAEDNLRGIARICARKDSEHNRELVILAKEEVARQREHLAWHARTEHGMP